MAFLLSHFIDQAADRDASREAFCGGGTRLTYGDLLDRSNRLAHLLRDEGVRPGDRVGIYMPRCVESALAVYGVLRAGAAFVPIDPQIPVNGLEQLLTSCGIRTLISHERARQELDEVVRRGGGPRGVIGIDQPIQGVRHYPWSELSRYPGESAPHGSGTELDMAYIMFSSGSTGRPKGIVHTHASGLAYAEQSAALYGVTPDDRIANHSPLHFDMSTFGYLTGPCAGATTLLIPEAYTKMAASLSQLIADEKITIWYSVPLALVQMLLRGVLESRDLMSVRWVLFGGEPFPAKHLRALMRQWPQARFSNVYGPAEVNQCTYYHVPPLTGDPEGDEPVKLGRIWDNAEGLIVDDEDRPVEPGEVGELLVRTPTMMRGYWKRPDLNASAYFHRDTESGLADTFYRTGDLVREDVEGEMHFLGRKDRQFKIRGYRVELDDVEHLLCNHDSVESAAVYPVRAGGDSDHIEAAVIPRSGRTVEPQELRTYLSDLLSWYAVPARVLVLKAFPRTTSGKIDRRLLQTRAEEAAVRA